MLIYAGGKSTDVDNCYKRADEFLKQLDADLKKAEERRGYADAAGPGEGSGSEGKSGS